MSRPLYNRGLFLLYLLLLVWAPLPLGSNRPWAWAVLELWVFSLAGLAALGWVASPWVFWYRDRTPWQRAPGGSRAALLVMLLGLLFLWFQAWPLPLDVLAALAPENAAWFQGLSSRGHIAATLNDARVAGLQQAAYVTFFALTLLLVDSSKRLRTVIYVMVGVALAESVYGLMAHFMREDFPLWRPTWLGHSWATGTFVNKNHYAANLSFGIALTIGLCLEFIAARPERHRGWGSRAIAERLTGALLEPGNLRFGLLVVLLTAFFFAQSRGAFLGLLVAGGALLVLGAALRGNGSAERRLLPLLAASAVLAAVWLSASGFFLRMLTYGFSDSGRLEVWSLTLDLYREHWLFGTGNGSFQHVFTRMLTPQLDGASYDFAHSDHLQLLLEQGLVGLLLTFAVFGICLGRMFDAYRQPDCSTRRQGLLLGILIAVAAFILHGFVDFNFHIPANALWFYALLGLGLVAAQRVVGVR